MALVLSGGLREQQADRKDVVRNRAMYGNTFLSHYPMNKALPFLLLVAGFAIAGYGLREKDARQATLDLGRTEIQLGEKDSVFSPYFVVGGLAAAAGLVLLLKGRKR